MTVRQELSTHAGATAALPATLGAYPSLPRPPPVQPCCVTGAPESWPTTPWLVRRAATLTTRTQVHTTNLREASYTAGAPTQLAFEHLSRAFRLTTWLVPVLLATSCADGTSSLSADRWASGRLSRLDATVMVDGDQAAALALAYVRTFQWNNGQGALDAGKRHVQSSSLSACGAAEYVQSPYDITDLDAPAHLRRAAGAHWLVDVCNGADLIGTVSVAEDVGAVAIRNGRVEFPPRSGNEFTFLQASESPAPVKRASREEVSALVSQVAGRGVTLPPQLVALDALHLPQQAVWRVQLDSSLSPMLASGARALETSALYVSRRAGPNGRLAVNTRDGDALHDALWMSAPDGSSNLVRISLTRRSGFERALTPVQDGGH